MSARLPVRGCPNTGVHEAHSWGDVSRQARGHIQHKWCPGRVTCVVCHRNVFRTTTQPLGTITGGGQVASGWKCSPRCR